MKFFLVALLFIAVSWAAPGNKGHRKQSDGSCEFDMRKLRGRFNNITSVCDDKESVERIAMDTLRPHLNCESEGELDTREAAEAILPSDDCPSADRDAMKKLLDDAIQHIERVCTKRVYFFYNSQQ